MDERDTTVKPARKHKQAHYHSAGEIQAKVDKANAKIADYTAQALLHEAKMRAAGAVGGKSDAAYEKSEAERYWSMIEYQQTVRLPKLKCLAGKLNTALLPWEGNTNESVV